MKCFRIRSALLALLYHILSLLMFDWLIKVYRRKANRIIHKILMKSFKLHVDYLTIKTGDD